MSNAGFPLIIKTDSTEPRLFKGSPSKPFDPRTDAETYTTLSSTSALESCRKWAIFELQGGEGGRGACTGDPEDL